jgi:hypothetical protein
VAGRNFDRLSRCKGRVTARAGVQEMAPAFLYFNLGYSRRVRGSPKWGNKLRSLNHVMADTKVPSRVSTISP